MMLPPPATELYRSLGGSLLEHVQAQEWLRPRAERAGILR